MESPPFHISPDCGDEDAARGFSSMANAMEGSAILKIAQEIRDLKASGVEVTDMTVGDFSPKEFPAPSLLLDRIQHYVSQGAVNYPPARGELTLRKAIRATFLREQGIEYPIESILVVSGGRPSLYSVYRLLTDPGDLVVCPVPSWNNHNYRDATGIKFQPVMTRKEDAFQPTLGLLLPHLKNARLFVLNTPQNPSGGVMPKSEVEKVGRFLVEENGRRRAGGDKPLYLLYDQIYRTVLSEGHEHWSPVQLVPECAPWVIHSDGISKAFCSTGLRCGWMVAPPAIAEKATGLMTHVGAWAPKPVQLAAADLLNDEEACRNWHRGMNRRVDERLKVLHEVLTTLQEEGLPVECIAPQGAMYISVRFSVGGKTAPDGSILEDNEAIRSWILKEAAFAVVPFRAFGVDPEDEDGWSRVSVGAVGTEDIRAALPRLRDTLSKLS